MIPTERPKAEHDLIGDARSIVTSMSRLDSIEEREVLPGNPMKLDYCPSQKEEHDEDAILTDTSSTFSLTSSFSSLGFGPTIESTLFTLREPRHGQSLLHLATKKQHLDVLQTLLRKIPEGAHKSSFVNAVDNSGNTALHFAVTASNPAFGLEATLLLSAHGAHRHMPNVHGISAIAAHVLLLKQEQLDICHALFVFKKNDLNSRTTTYAMANAKMSDARISSSILALALDRRWYELAQMLVHEGAEVCNVPELTYGQMRVLSRSIAWPPMLGRVRDTNACLKCGTGPFVMPFRQREGALASSSWTQRLKRFWPQHKRSTEVPHRHCFRCGLVFCVDCTEVKLDRVHRHDFGQEVERPSVEWFETEAGYVGPNELSIPLGQNRTPHVCDTCDQVLHEKWHHERKSTEFEKWHEESHAKFGRISLRY